MRKILHAILLCLPLFVAAQPYKIKQLGIKEGLSNNHVVSVAQDKRGFIWFATEEGLNKFDGIHFIPYYTEEQDNGESITGNELNCLLDDPVDSILWIATQRAGLNAYNYTNNTFKNFRHDKNNPSSLITDDITKIVPAADGNLWICTYWKGIDYLDKQTGTFTHFNTRTVRGLASDQVWSAADDGNGLLYIGHVHQGFTVLSIKDRTAKNFTHNPQNKNSLLSDEVTCIYKDHIGNIWVGTNKGLSLFNHKTETFVPINDKNNNLSRCVHDIKQTKDNKLWVAMELGGIAIIDLSQHLFSSGEEVSFQFIKEGDDEYGLSSSSMRCLLQDSFNNIWIGSWGGGINFISNEPALFNSYKYSPRSSGNYSMTSRVALGLSIDKNGKIWVGTEGGGINVFQQERRVAVYNTENSNLHTNTVQTVLCDSKGGLWFGFFNGGIAYYNPKNKNFRQILPKEKSQTDVRSFYEDNQGNIWTGTSEGIYLIDRDKLSIKAHYDKENNLARCILKDSKGRIWVGFFGSGLVVYDSQLNAIKQFNVMNKFPSNTINALYQDRKKRLWVATGEGLVCFPSLSELNYKVYRRKNGLVNTHIQAIGEDKQGNIWVSTNKGISCFIDAKGSFYNYDHRDNLPMGSFSSGSLVRDRKGNFYFGSINGLCCFNPEQVLRERQSPPAFITNIEIFNSLNNPNSQYAILLNEREEVKLKYKQNSFKVSFNVQNYALGNQVEYAYMLKGLEDTWYTVTDLNNVTFRNLPPGEYQFQVKTRMRNQKWSNEITPLNIYIAPPLWLTWWAKAVYLSICLGTLFFILYAYKKRIDAEILYKLERQSHEQEQDLNNERLRFYTNITHELRTPLTLILGPLEDILKGSSLSTKDAQKISMINQSAVRLLKLINQILEFRKTETQNKKLCVSRDNIVSQVQEIGLKYQELNQKSEVDIRLKIEEENILMYFDKEVLNIVLDNLISNAIKYTEKGSITIGMQHAERSGKNYIDIWIADTGHGIKPEALPHIFERYYQEGGKHQASGSGIGLSLVKNLVTLHEGEIHVESTPNKGSTFSVSLQRDNSYPNVLHADSNEKEENLPAEPIQEVEVSSNQKPILLVVEDNPDIRNYIAESFSDSFEVQTAHNGKQGKKAALKSIPDIIVSDIMMPEMDGNEMCRELKKDVRTSHIPIILLTAKDSLQDKEEGYQVGADSYLTKPFSASLLYSRIDNLLQSRIKLAEHFGAIASKMNSKAATITESLNKIDNEFIQKINQLIEERLSSDKVDISYLADNMCMSSSTLYRKMKALTGLSTNEYIRKMKMKYAEQFLLEGKYNISEIAFKVGINNLFYFRQCFKEEFNDTPSEYLKKLKENVSQERTS
ncbi:hybrid sensor histidine kinase/response regulator transcription factor [Bacteroides ihuae]|uniref:hybrid sensor histidine kinase/response regulator transcription factor n=1 Tax=Bacteroides ihuae TaxID=1852362 RepID=UPI0008DA8DB7|nr:hybrid sensor histidine kinase/response regulator transcription factor [Bacteroides ihuae]